MSTPTFQRISTEMFERLLRSFHFSRQINAVHMHHTWRPRHADFRGHSTIVSMWRHHTQTNGWSDIAQHITIDPDGMIWLGRNWNLSPASASGHNGNSRFGPFMFEIIGDFDRGRDAFEGRQKDAVVRVIAALQERFKLPAESLRFHNMMSAKSCPGSAVDFRKMLDEVARVRAEMAGAVPPAGGGTRSPFPNEADAALRDAMRALQRVTDNSAEPADAEHDDEHDIAPEAAAARGGASGRPGPIDPAEMAAMRPHFINLSAGEFSDDGQAWSTPAEVDAIFEQHLQREADALAANDTLRIVLFAHGGLVSEAAGLETVRRHLGWWRANGVYPIFFIWETGFWASVRQLIWPPGGAPAARGWLDRFTDPLIERTARTLRGPGIWGSMKRSAERAAEPGGGSHYAADKLVAFCARNPGRVELHAIGHSAGSIFHAHFLPLLEKPQVPKVKTLHLLAPAIRVDAGKQLLIDPIRNGKLAEHLTIYTMHRDVELADNCATIYRKSLLYLIHHALEDRDPTPLLGLQDSLRGDAGLKSFFGLAGERSDLGEVIWSPTDSEDSRSASRATSHGGFDDDRATMNSVARRVLGLDDAMPLPRDFPLPDKARGWTDDSIWPPELLSEPGWPAAAAPVWQPAGPPSWSSPAAPMPTASAAPPAHPDGAPAGRRSALCVGIDAYPDPAHRLGGCVNDARNWSATLARLGFEIRMLLDGQATRAALTQELEQLVTGSRAGDVIVFQFAGHGTHVPDLDGDESDGQDEALCPVDFASGALYIDDDIAQLIGRLPDGVNLTLFTDCCHSGTNTRFAGGSTPVRLAPGVRSRHVPPTAEVNEAHRRFRAQHGGTRAAPGGSGGAQRMRDVKFAACLDHQVALESAGSGEFTQRALRVLERGIQGLTHERFLQAVVAEFGSGAAQQPLLDCAPDARQRALLQPLGRAAGAGDSPDASAAGAGLTGDALLLQTVNALAQSVVALTSRTGR